MTLDKLLDELTIEECDTRSLTKIKQEIKTLPFVILINDRLNGVRLDSKHNKMILVNGCENDPNLQQLQQIYNKS